MRGVVRAVEHGERLHVSVATATTSKHPINLRLQSTQSVFVDCSRDVRSHTNGDKPRPPINHAVGHEKTVLDNCALHCTCRADFEPPDFSATLHSEFDPWGDVLVVTGAGQDDVISGFQEISTLITNRRPQRPAQMIKQVRRVLGEADLATTTLCPVNIYQLAY